MNISNILEKLRVTMHNYIPSWFPGVATDDCRYVLENKKEKFKFNQAGTPFTLVVRESLVG